jgi:hypothetical protein
MVTLVPITLGSAAQTAVRGWVALISGFSRQYNPYMTMLLQTHPARPCYPTLSGEGPEVLLGADVHLASRVDSYLVWRPRFFVREDLIR